MTRIPRRCGFTLLEFLVVIAIIGMLMWLLLSAVQQVRGRALQTKCSHQLRQVGLALHQFHDTNHQFPKGHHLSSDVEGRPYSGWTISVLPYLEQDRLHADALSDYRAAPYPFQPPHRHLSTVVQHFVCPADARARQAQTATKSKLLVAFTSYLGVSGRDYSSRDGILFQNSSTTITSVFDGTSNTLLLGERPPSHDYQFGWWYAGVGQKGTGSADLILGVREQNLQPIISGSTCGAGAYSFRPSRFNDPCGMFHFWSPHTGGANFALADGSVRYIGYGAAPLLPELASRAGGEATSLP
ncbi:MAG: DUF1559 domain-containing protein [Gemmataceae bacterium]|nr:DUF1559 domain-containing protein [Gemmataceae bacterium]